MRIIGIDPGIATTGYGVIEHRGNRFCVLQYDCIKTPSGSPPASRLQSIYSSISDVLRSYRPEHFAVEELFFNQNTRTAMAVGQARGVAILAAAHMGLHVFEYTPLQVKQAVAGYGKAGKSQVQFMVKSILGLNEYPRPDDAADALAVGICHAHRRTGLGGTL